MRLSPRSFWSDRSAQDKENNPMEGRKLQVRHLLYKRLPLSLPRSPVYKTPSHTHTHIYNTERRNALPSPAVVSLVGSCSSLAYGANGKAKWRIPLADATIGIISPSTQGSVVSGTSSRSSGLSSNKFKFHITSGAERPEFKCNIEGDRASWDKLLGLLALFLHSHIPGEPMG